MKTLRTSLLVGVALIAAAPAFAQVSITGTIAGTVTDTTDAVITGASVNLKDEGTGLQKTSVTDGQGAFAFRELNFGTYQVTVTLQGFKTAIYKKVLVESGRTTDLRIRLAVGGLEDTITVEGATPVLEISSNKISGTLGNKEITELPLGGDGRNAFSFARLVPGAVAPAGTGSTHYNGLPGGTINPTIDGVNNSSNGFKSGGTSFFGTVPARVGAIEEVTVETAGLGGDSGVTGGVNLKFVTKRGTSVYHGSFFEQYRTEKLNANTFGNVARGLPEDQLRRHDFGGNFGGPLFPHGSLRQKLFIFVNYEQQYIPQTQTRAQTLLTLEANQGIFRYQTAAGEQRTANLLTLAGQFGFQSTLDPTMAAFLSMQQQSRSFATVVSTNSLRTESINWREPQKQINTYPTVRFDAQISPNLAFMTSFNRYNQDARGRRLWPLPGFPIQSDTFDAGWWIQSSGLNWSINSNAHNEFRFGVQHSGDTNELGRDIGQFSLNGRVQGNYARFSLPLGLSNLSNTNAPVIGEHYITTITDELTFLRGNHTWAVGGNYRDTQWHDRSLDAVGAGYLGVNNYSIGSPTGDPVQAVFVAANIPGLQTTDQAAAQQLYAVLTGRLTSIAAGKVVDPDTLQYSDSVFRQNWTSAWFAGMFIQDRWRATRSLTLNYGLRWEMNQPPFNHNGTTAFPDDANLLGPSTSLFHPGQLDGVQNPTMRRGKKAAGTDWNNLAPRFGFTWAPNFEGGLASRLFGTGQDTVFRGGYDLTYFDEGTNMFASSAGNNPGQSQVLRLASGDPGFAPGALTLQSPLPAFTAFPLAYKDEWGQSEFTFGGTSISSMKSTLKTPYVQAWNIGLQRLLMRNTVVEIRYIGNKASHVWNMYNLNEVNIFESGFLTDFLAAQKNLSINVANGLTGFANNGLPGQSALPLLEAAFGARGAQAALPGSQGFTSTGFITNLQQGEAGRMAATLAGTTTYYCRLVGNTFSPCATPARNYNAPGPYPINLFQANPYAIGGGLNWIDDNSSTKYHGLQLQLRRRLWKGASATVNYTFAKNWSDIWADNATQSHTYRTLRDKSLDFGPAPFDVRHVLQSFGTYDLPFGRGRHFNIDNPVLNGIVGGWTIGGILTAQSGTPFRLTSGRQTVNGSDAGVILMNGHTAKEIQNMIGIFPGPVDPLLGKVVTRYWIDPKLIGPDGRANPEYLAPPTTPGEFGQLLYFYGRPIWNIDASLTKTTSIFGRPRLTIHVAVLNLLNHAVWNTPGFLSETSIQSQTFGLSTNPQNNTGTRQVYATATIMF